MRALFESLISKTLLRWEFATNPSGENKEVYRKNSGIQL